MYQRATPPEEGMGINTRVERAASASMLRPEYLFVVRESGRSQAALLKMLEQTLKPNVTVPGVSLWERAGVVCPTGPAIDSGDTPEAAPRTGGPRR